MGVNMIEDAYQLMITGGSVFITAIVVMGVVVGLIHVGVNPVPSVIGGGVAGILISSLINRLR